MTKKKIKPPRAPRVLDVPRRAPDVSHLAVVRVSDRTIEIVNLDRISHAIFSVLPEGDDVKIALWTPEADDAIEFVGKPAADLLSHLVLIGCDVEGGSAALARVRGEMYAPYVGGFADVERVPDVRDALDRLDEEGGGCANFTPPPAPPISVEEHAAELRAIRASAKVALAEIHAGEVDAEIRALDEEERDRGISRFQDTRASCAFGENCRRFPACGDCSLYALDRACESAHLGDAPEGDGDRRVVHVEHVEQVAGETSAALLDRVQRCGVFVGMKGAGVVPGEKWCGVGHEMTDPACALCPYLRIYAPATPIGAR